MNLSRLLADVIVEAYDVSGIFLFVTCGKYLCLYATCYRFSMPWFLVVQTLNLCLMEFVQMHAGKSRFYSLLILYYIVFRQCHSNLVHADTFSHVPLR